MTDTGQERSSPELDHMSTGQLLTRAMDQTSELVRSEVALAKAEIQQTVRSVGLGAGFFGTAGVVALYGAGCLVAAAILALSLVLAPWLSAVLVGAVLFVVAAVAALLGRKKVSDATPPMESTKVNVQRDVDTVKRSRS